MTESGTRPPDDLGRLSVAEMDALLDRLEPEERDVSARRRRAHERIDTLRADVRAGLAPEEKLEELEAWERGLSAERRSLHEAIDALYRERERRGAPRRRRLSTGDRGERQATLSDPDAGRHGTLERLPRPERPPSDDESLGYGPSRLERPPPVG